ncbi:MAG TPA: PEGA domain-containing protein [Polyangiaceae bacterium]
MKLKGEIVGAGLALVVSVLGLAPELRAEGPGSGAAQPAELARMRYRQGVDAYRGGRYRESIDYFLEADALAPSAALSYNIARAYEKIDDPGAALRWYRDYLRRAPDAKDRAETEVLAHGFEQRLAEKGVQQVTVLSAPRGATVLIDDTAVGITPFTTEIPPGTHRVELRLDGYEPASSTLELPPDHAVDLAVTLSARAAPATESKAPTAAAAPAAPNSAQSPDRAQKSPGGFPTKIVGWTLVGAGGAALGASLVFELLRHGAESDAKKETTQIGYADRLDTMESRQTAARIFAVTGAVLAIGGGVVLVVGGRKREDTAPAVSAACVPSMCWSTVRGAF